MKLRLTLDLDTDLMVIPGWDKHQTEFYWNEGSGCVNNLLKELGWRHDYDECMCNIAHVEMMEEEKDD